MFFSVVILLVPILREGLTPQRFRRLERELPVSRRTVQRWRRWWRRAFITTPLWRRVRAESLPLEETRLPGSFLEAFSRGPDGVVSTLRWLASLGAGGQVP